MAKKSSNTRKNNSEESTLTLLKNFFTNERTRFISGLILSILTIYVGLALISFFFSGAADQSKIENLPVSDLVAYKGSVNNWTGVRGAYLANLLMNHWFGISSFILLYFFGSVGAKLMNFKGISIIKRFLFSASLLIWGSLFFAFVFIKGYEDSFIYLGGQHGYYLSELIVNNIGIPGMTLFLIGTVLIIAILSSKQTIPFLQRVFTFSWMKIPFKKQPTKGDDSDKVTITPKDTANDIYATEDDEDNDAENEDDFFKVTIAKGDEDEEEYLPNVSTVKQEENQLPEEKNKSEFNTIEIPDGDGEAYDGSDLGDYDPKLDLSSFRSPTLELLKKYNNSDHQVDMEEQTANQKRIKQTLENFGISIASIKATVGPTITLYEVVPDAGVRISKIRNLEDDIALSLAALGIRIIAPMPGKGTIGIEVPNKDPQIVSMQSIIASRKFQECKYDLPVALGKTITNEIFMFDLCKMPHLLVAGATGQGKSVGLNAIITSLLYKKHPSELKFVLVDPKMVEFSIYAEIERHYLAKLPDVDKPIITDFTKVIQTLNSLCKEMDDRYKLLEKAHTRNVTEYNTKFISRHLNPNKGHKYMPYIVVIIDEYGDLIMTAGKEIELPIARIAQKARAVGIHMIIATQRPSTNIITGTIKANFPARVAFRVQSMIDSRTILDSPGANQLIGRGDLLFSQGNETTRVQCAFVDTPEVEKISEFIGGQVGYPTAFELPEYYGEGDGSVPGAVDLSDKDPLFDEAARLIVMQQQGSTSSIQRKFSIGYNRAGRLMDQLEAAGIVGPSEGSKARQVLLQDEYSLEQLLNNLK
ncbi:MAG: DNA translocase FtsK [Tannerellaceae bacterium]|jgi:S-DNA-T family DNA segregation ATPase FtsK/SpoIIIE|nr:DNA translocase FtsK [Tannerellaceae bacterium]